ncbi:MAG TPA: NfeD family protein [Pirellulales bacterium]|jgi:membrane-bound ClpP family serine protease|nr:NfeD family protein [Pirellulales bacterium]
MEPLVWAGLLLLLGMLLVLLEVFVPTAGVLGFLSVAAILSGIGLAFYNGGLTVGFGFLFGTAVVLPIVLALAFRWFPETPIGRRLLPNLPTSDEVLPDNEERRVLRGLLGKVGQAKSQMLPSGSVVVEGRTIDAVSEGLPIDAGQNVRVIEVRGSRVVVRPLEEGEAATPARPETDDLLSRPIDSLGIEYPDDPLA